MVRECSANGSCFGICLMNNAEDGQMPATHLKVGTTAEICDFSTLDDGLLGIVAQGKQKFLIQSTSMRDNGLLMADVEFFSEPESTQVPEQFSVLSMIAARFMELLSDQYPDFEPAQLQDTVWLGYRLSELLPLELDEKQVLLQLHDPLERLQVLQDILPRFQKDAED